MTRAYGVPIRRSPPLRLARHTDAPNGGAFRRWLTETDRPLAIDLFSGAGGLSLGLEAAGYRVALAVDVDEWALETHGHNFEGLALALDLGDQAARDSVVAMLDGVHVDLVAGGPPCQPYSRAGRSKIRSLVEAGSRDAHDHRRELWRAFLDIVERVQPRAVMMENVPDMALGDDSEVLRRILSRLEDAGYNADARLVDTWLYGVPQHRQRLVVVGVAEGSGFEWPAGGEEVHLRDAISDLPVLDPTLDDVGAVAMPYAGPLTDYQRAARKECSGEDADVVYDHVTRAVRRDDLKAFELMRPGTLYSDLPEHLRRYRADIFDDKYNRLGWDELSRSITAHIAKDGYWYIHPDQHRTLTVREAARVQTFPDHFRFAGTRSHQFAQIGNAVPPSLGRAIGEALLHGRGIESDGMHRLAEWRHELRNAVLSWAAVDYERAPWAYPTDDPWVVAVGEILGGSQSGWPLPRDVLELVPTWNEATPEILNALLTMTDPGPRRRAVQRLLTVAAAVREDLDEWDGVEWMGNAGLGSSQRQWIELLGWGDGVVASSGVLRVTARLTGTAVDTKNRMSNGRMELAKLVGDGETAPTINAGLRRIGTVLCTAEAPSCHECPLQRLCGGTC